MKRNNQSNILLLCGLLAGMAVPAGARAQNEGPPIEQWRSFLTYNQANGVATDGGTLFFVATTSGFYTYDREDGSMTAYSKSNGMSDIGLTGVAYDKLTQTVLLAYSNSNIDLFKGLSFSNLPELKLTATSDKSINHVMAYEGRGYLSTGLGLVIVNLNKREIKETVVFSKDGQDAKVFSTVLEGDILWAATSMGLFKINRNNTAIQFQSEWQEVGDGQAIRSLEYAEGQVYASQNDSLFRVEGNALRFLEKTSYPIVKLDKGLGGLWLSVASEEDELGYCLLRRADGTRADSFATVSPRQVVQLPNGDVWFADNSRYIYTQNHGLRKKIDNTTFQPYFPNGPITNSFADVCVKNGEIWAAHGGKDISWKGSHNRANFSVYKDGTWKNYPWVDNNEWVQDFIRILKDWNSGTVYVASLSGGLLELKPDGQWKVYNEGYFAKSSGSTPGNDLYEVSGLALDENGNLWMTNYMSTGSELVVKTRDGNWPSLKTVPNPKHMAADVIIDDYGQKWFICPNTEGVAVYNDNGTVDKSSDDKYALLKQGKGAGGLPDNNAISIAKDRGGAIWIGTGNGIGIVNCPGDVIAGKCEAELRVLQADQFADHLFANQAVKAIAVDGANRKWIGTTNGVWLVSDNAEETIYHFTQANSPLPSDNIERIYIDPDLGDVYFCTDMGLVSFRGTATDGYAELEDPLFIYPNPVPSGYNGMIAVRGLVDNSDVRITDISGQLVYRTKALGGQAVWNGKDYTGRKVQSGVYLVFVVNKDGSQKATGKFVVHE